jgi:hypothetical protein
VLLTEIILEDQVTIHHLIHNLFIMVGVAVLQAQHHNQVLTMRTAAVVLVLLITVVLLVQAYQAIHNRL